MTEIMKLKRIVVQYNLLILMKLKMELLLTLISQKELKAKLSFRRCH